MPWTASYCVIVLRSSKNGEICYEVWLDFGGKNCGFIHLEKNVGEEVIGGGDQSVEKTCQILEKNSGLIC